jgi:hypothetical protein
LLSRRRLLLSTASLGLGATLLPAVAAAEALGCPVSKTPAPSSPTAGRRPHPNPTPTPTPGESTRSYGPNGTHWPSHTPRDTFSRVIDVPCSWAAIRSALGAVTAYQAASGLNIRVAPGTLPGGGRDVLANVGSASWARNVLVSPRDGWGTVTISDTANLRDVRGVTFARINAHHLRLIDCSRTAWAHSKLTLGMRTYARSGAVSQCNAYEVVMPDSKADPTDPFSYAASANASLNHCVWEGCYGAAVFRPAGSSAHLDTFQMFGAGSYRGLTIRDSIFFGGNNCGLQIGGYSPSDPLRGTDFLVLDHSMVLSQVMSVQTRYRVPRGARTGAGTQAINGAGEPHQLSAINGSYVLGTMHVTRWKRITDSYTSVASAASRYPARSGGWIYKPSLAGMTSAELNSLAPVPTDSYLRSIWT